ncbi:MAG: 5-formyltetrahydrofolate cyclo-ligase [Kiritimatiellia bacterium]
MNDSKELFRQKMKALRAAMTPQERSAARIAVAEAFTNCSICGIFNRYRTFATYLSVKDEMPTEELNTRLFSGNRWVCTPRWDSELEKYQWAWLKPGALMALGPHHIPEPVSREKFPESEVEVALIPGLAFDFRGGRIGYGAAIYDRLLTRFRPSTIKVALAFDCQVLREELPQEPHDILMDIIITENYWIDCRRARQVRRETSHV